MVEIAERTVWCQKYCNKYGCRILLKLNYQSKQTYFQH